MILFYSCFATLKNHTTGPLKQIFLWSFVVWWENDVDWHYLLLAIQPLYSGLKVCVCGQTGSSQYRFPHVCWTPSRVQDPKASALLFIDHISWRSSKPSWQGWYCWKQLLFVDRLMLLTSAEQGLQHALDQFAVMCQQARTKLVSIKISMYDVSLQTWVSIPYN